MRILDNLNDMFGQSKGECAGCDIFSRVNDLGLCETCDAKVDRDMIRQRAWDHSVSAFGCPPEKREALRNAVISEFGEKLELIAPDKTSRSGSNKTKPKKKKRKSGKRR
ncbi:hypothetical protein ACFLS1_08975 [Verrucomicrobiota bacterium]